MSEKQIANVPTRDIQGVSQMSAALSVREILEQVSLIQEIMRDAMKTGEHFGTIPGCGTKPTLLKPGAEKLCLTFRLAPQYDIKQTDLPNGHREYQITTTLLSINTTANVGQGVGSCSTMEGKYRYRGNNAEVTDQAVPRAYWDLKATDPAKAQELIGGKGFTVKKVDGKGWMIAKAGERAENPDIADTYNVVLKMAKKRSLVDAVLTATAASDIFTQDLEDITTSLEEATRIERRQEEREQAAEKVRQQRPALEAVVVDEKPKPATAPAIIRTPACQVSQVTDRTVKIRDKDKLVYDVVLLDDNGEELTASTFSKTLSLQARQFGLDSTRVIAGIKEAKKPDYWTLYTLEKADDVSADEVVKPTDNLDALPDNHW